MRSLDSAHARPVVAPTRLAAGLVDSACLAPLPQLLGMLASPAWPDHAQAICADAELMGHLAKFTTRCCRVLLAPEAGGWQEEPTPEVDWSEAREQLRCWCATWGTLPWPADAAARERSREPLLRVALRVLQGEAGLLAGLPVKAPGGIKPDRELVERLATCWHTSLELASEAAMFLSGEGGATRRWHALQLLASAAPHVVRLCAALASGHGFLEQGLDDFSVRQRLNDALSRWCQACAAAARPAEGAAASREPEAVGQQHAAQQDAAAQQADAAVQLASCLVHTLALMPRLPHLLNGDSGVPGSCGCLRCLGDSDTMRMDAAAAVQAVADCLSMLARM